MAVRGSRRESDELRARAHEVRERANEILRRSDALVVASWDLKGEWLRVEAAMQQQLHRRSNRSHQDRLHLRAPNDERS